jgi:hypothetical protein
MFRQAPPPTKKKQPFKVSNKKQEKHFPKKFKEAQYLCFFEK